MVWYCPYCSSGMKRKRPRHPKAETREHIVPVCRGGGPTIKACKRCNHDKADRSLDSWYVKLIRENDGRHCHVLAFMAANPELMATIRALERAWSTTPMD
jgi:hypothetical protein